MKRTPTSEPIQSDFIFSLRLLTASIAAAWEPPPAISIAEWCETNLWLPVETSATPGRYDLSAYSYFRELLDAVDDPEVEMIVLEFATQLGKTTFLQAVLAASAILSPAPAMLGTPDKDSLLELRDKFYALCETSPALRHTIPPERQRNNRWIDVGQLRCQLAYSYNTQRMSGKSCALVLATELDRWRKTKTHGDPAKIIAQRVKAFHRSKIIYESTPSDEESRIDRLYRLSDRRRYLVPCPRCNHFQELRFFPLKKGSKQGLGGVDGLKDQKGRWLSSDRVRGTAFYRCEQGCKIQNEQKSAMVCDGRWVPAGQSIDAKGKLQGNPLRTKRILGARLNSMYAAPVSFGKIAAEYLDSRDNQADLQVFFNDWLSLRWKKKTKVPKWRELGIKLAGHFAPGIVPPQAVFLTAGCDPGPGYVRYVVRAWGEGGTSWKIESGTTKRTGGDATSHLKALKEVLVDRVFPLATPTAAGETGIKIRRVAIDVGYKPIDVHNFVRSLKAGNRVIQVAGKRDLPGGRSWDSSLVEVSPRSGKVYIGGQLRWLINRAVFNQDLFDRWRQPMEEPGAWWLTNASLAQEEQYLRELTNEQPVKTFDKRGRQVTEWHVIDRNVGAHSWDCEVYARAVAEMICEHDWLNIESRLRRQRAAAAAAKTSKRPTLTMPDGRPFFVLDRK